MLDHSVSIGADRASTPDGDPLSITMQPQGRGQRPPPAAWPGARQLTSLRARDLRPAPALLGLRDSMMAANLLAIAERGPALVSAHNGHLQRNKSTMRMGDLPLKWWSAGAIVNAHLGDGYAFLATALGTIRHQGVDAPPPDTVEGLLYALPQQRCLVDARRLAAVLGDATPAPRVSPWHGYSPLDPAHLASNDGIVFVKDAPPS